MRRRSRGVRKRGDIGEGLPDLCCPERLLDSKTRWGHHGFSCITPAMSTNVTDIWSLG